MRTVTRADIAQITGYSGRTRTCAKIKGLRVSRGIFGGFARTSCANGSPSSV